MTNKTDVTIIIPAYNEEETVGDVIHGIKQIIDKTEYEYKIIVVNDGSTDNTANIAKEAGADKLVSHDINKGLGVAFRTGIETALEMNADIIVNIDADGQFNPNDIPRLIRPIIEGKADMVTCSRFLDKNLEPDMPWIKKFGNAIFTKLVNRLTKQKFTDTQCGFRAYSKEVALRMTLFGVYTYTQEVFLDLIAKGLKVVEIPCKVKGQRKGKSKVVNNVFSYGFKSLVIIIRTIRDYRPLEFFGIFGITLLSIGFVTGSAIIIRWLLIRDFGPYRTLAGISFLLFITGLLLFFIALIADMVGRERKLVEEILYKLRREK